MAIFILAILLSLVASLANSVHVDLKASGNYRDEAENEALLDAGIAHGMAILQDATDTSKVTLNDDWTQFGSNGSAQYSLGAGTYQVQILDASARLNLNTVTREALLTLPGVTEEIADSIIDWRDADDNPGAQGAESDTYQAYPRPYSAKNGPFDLVDELLLVKGITAPLLYGDPTQAATTMGS